MISTTKQMRPFTYILSLSIIALMATIASKLRVRPVAEEQVAAFGPAIVENVSPVLVQTKYQNKGKTVDLRYPVSKGNVLVVMAFKYAYKKSIFVFGVSRRTGYDSITCLNLGDSMNIGEYATSPKMKEVDPGQSASRYYNCQDSLDTKFYLVKEGK